METVQLPSKDSASPEGSRFPGAIFGSPSGASGSSVTDPRHARKRALLRVFSLILLLGIAASLIDLSEVWVRLRAIPIWIFAVMVAIQAGIVLILSWRFAILARSVGADLRLSEATRLTFLTTLGNLLLPTGLAGDAGRVLLVRKYGLSLSTAMAVGVFDRIIGLAALGAIVLVGAIAAASILPIYVALAAFVVPTTITVAILIWWQRSAKNKAALGPAFLSVAGLSAALSIFAHLASILIAYLFFLEQGAPVGFFGVLVLFPAVLLAATLPISVGGWGTREFAAAAAFATIGVEAPTAIAMAVIFGLSQAVAAAIGSAATTLFSQTDAAR